MQDVYWTSVRGQGVGTAHGRFRYLQSGVENRESHPIRHLRFGNDEQYALYVVNPVLVQTLDQYKHTCTNRGLSPAAQPPGTPQQ